MGDDLASTDTEFSDGSASAPSSGKMRNARLVQALAQASGDGPSDASPDLADRKDESASSEAQEAVLRKLLTATPDDVDAYEALARLYAEGGRWSDLAELHAGRYDAVTDPRERAALLRKVAELLRERFDDDAAAFDVLLEALREDFTDEESARDLEALARWNDRWGEVLVAANDWLRDPDVASAQRVALLARVAGWYGEELGKPEWGLPYVQEAQELAPNDLRVLRTHARVLKAAGKVAATEPLYRRILEVDAADEEALESLERILLARGAVYDLVAFLEGRLRGRESDASLNALRVRLSTLHCQLPGGDARAFELLECALDLEPCDAMVLAALDARCVLSRRWGRLEGVLEARIDLAQTEDERCELLLRLARLLEEEHLDPDGAAQRLEQLLEVSPGCDEAYRALERCYAKLRLWDAAVHAYERHHEHVDDRESRLHALTGMARVLLDELGLPERALESYRLALEIDPHRVATHEAMARVHERLGDAAGALASLSEVVEREADPVRKVEAMCRLAAAHRARLGDVVTARTLYRRALELDPTHTGALSALRQIALEIDDVAEAVRLLDREQRHTPNARVRARLLVELAVLRRDRLDDAHGAQHAFEEAYAADHENEDAAMAVAEARIERCEWSVVEPILERLARTASRRPVFEQQRIFEQLGRTHAARGEHARALDAFRKATRLGAVDVEVLRGLADAAFEVGVLEEALAAQQKVVTVLDDDAPDRADALHRLGEIQRRLGDDRRAASTFERALAVDASHRPSLEALLDLHALLGEWDQVAVYEQRLLAAVRDPKARLSLLRALSRRWAEEAGDAARAAASIEAGLAIDPRDRRLLLQLLQTRETAGDHRGVIDAIRRLVAVEDDPHRRARYLLTIADVARESLCDDDVALEACEAALEDDPTLVAAFRTVERILTARADWSGLERAYRKMVLRARSLGDTELEFELWHALGVVYRDQLRDPSSSLEAFRMASRLRPDDSHERRIIAELCIATDRTDLAIAELQQAIARDPMDVQHHRALYRLYARTGQLDRAYCVAAALVFLKGADAEQRACYAELRPKGVPPFRARLGRGPFLRSLLHPDLDRAISSVFETIGRAARAMKARASSGQSGLQGAVREDPQRTDLIAAKAFFGAATVLGIEAPQLWVRRDLPGGLAPVPIEAAATLMGSTLLRGWSVPELMFVFGKHLVLQHGEHEVRAHFPSVSELRALLLAALSIAVPTAADEGEAVARTAKALARELRPDERDRLGHVASSVLELGTSADVVRWLQCSEATGLRAGLLLSGDLSVAAKVVRQEPVFAGDLSPNEKVRELVRFAVSDAYDDLRKAIGIAVEARNLDDDDDDEPTRERKLCA